MLKDILVIFLFLLFIGIMEIVSHKTNKQIKILAPRENVLTDRKEAFENTSAKKNTAFPTSLIIKAKKFDKKVNPINLVKTKTKPTESNGVMNTYKNRLETGEIRFISPKKQARTGAENMSAEKEGKIKDITDFKFLFLTFSPTLLK